jgi:tetratricopeptide (TPR) repeat protein
MMLDFPRRATFMRAIHNRAVASILLILVTCAVFWQSGGHQFVNFDDGSYILENPHVRTGLSMENVIWAFTTAYASNWHPLTWISHMLDVRLFGLDPGPPHLENVLFHALNAVLLFLLLLRMTEAYWQSVLVAALFALHPLHVESVAWVAERKDVLSAFFWMLTLLLYHSYVQRPDRTRYLLTLAAFACGLMAKPMLVTLPIVLLLMDYWPLGRLQRGQTVPIGDRKTLPVPAVPLRWLVREKIPFFALTAVSSIITLYAQHKGGAVSSLKIVPLPFRFLNALWSYVLYLARMIWPADLAVIYPLPPTLSITKGLFAVALLGGISILAVRSAKKHAFVLVGWLWYLVTLVPVIGLVQVGSQSMADRYSYLPLIGIFIILAWGAALLAGRDRLRRFAVSAAAVVLLAACATVTWFQLGYWKNSITLFSHAASSVVDNCIAHEALGLVLAKSGRLDEAVDQYAESLRIWPEYDRALIGMGNVLVRQGRMQEAATFAKRALRLKPESSEARFLLGFILMNQGRSDEALEEYFAGLRSDPENAGIHHIVGVILGTQGKLDASREQFAEALRIKPDYADAHFGLGVALLRQKKIDESIEQFTEALRLKPDFAQARAQLDEAMRLKKDGR